GGVDESDVRHGHEDEWYASGWGDVWGLLIGALWAVPVVVALAGAGLGALHKATENTGITKEQLETIRSEITEGTSGLFLVTEEGDLDRLGERFHGWNSKLIATNLTEGERSILIDTCGGA